MFSWQVTPVSDRMGPVAGVPAEVPRLRAAEVARDHQILGDASGPGEAARLQAGLWPGGHRVLPVLLPILQHFLIPPRSLSCASSFRSISWWWWVPQGLSQGATAALSHQRGPCTSRRELHRAKNLILAHLVSTYPSLESKLVLPEPWIYIQLSGRKGAQSRSTKPGIWGCAP